MGFYLPALLVYIAFNIWFNLKIEGKENIPKGKAFVYASNHKSYVDPILVVLAGRGKFSFMAKSELFENRLFGWFIRILGAFPVERGKGDTAAIDRSIECVNKGRNLVIFPEGTRSKDGRVGRGKAGVALIAAKAGTDVIPIGLNYEGKLHFRSRIVVRVGKPIPITPPEKSLDERQTLRYLKKDVLPPIMDGIKALVDEPKALPMPETEEE